MKNLHYLLLVLISMSYFSCKENEKESKLQTTKEQLVPPIPAADIIADEFQILPQKDTVIYHKSGSIITIPKEAFLDESGNVITSPVDLKFRMFSNPLEIYLAGIPMNFTNSNGEELVFESAGMFEITATNKGNLVQVNPENKIKVAAVSFTEDPKFNRYDLDPNTNSWHELGKDQIISTSKTEEISQLPEAPIPPKEAGKFAFQVFDDLNEKDKLEEYKDVWFEPVDGKKCGFNFTKDILVEDLKNGTYKVTFVPWGKISDTTKSSCICYLSFKDKVQYSKALTNYQKKYAKLISKLEKERKRINDVWEIYDKKVKEYNFFIGKNEIEKLTGNNKILRTLEINQFGLVNLDYPHSYPKGANIEVVYLDENGNKLDLKQVVLVEIGKNALYRYTNSIHFNPESQNILWGLTKTNKLAYFTIEDFKALKERSGKVKLKMRVHPKELKTYEDIMNVLFKS